MEIRSDSSVGDIVKYNFKAAQIFDKYKIDFCCGGSITLGEACKKSDADFESVLPELEELLVSEDPDSKYMDSLSLDALCDYIEKRHHPYVSESIPFLQQKLQKLCDVHGDHHPELFEVRDLFQGAAENLTAHMKKEELILFPYIKRMVKSQKEKSSGSESFKEISKTISVMEDEHQVEGERFGKISLLTDNYSCPPDGCTTFQVTYQSLKEFEKDLHRHIHLENNLLFKKAVILERELS